MKRNILSGMYVRNPVIIHVVVYKYVFICMTYLNGISLYVFF